MAQPATTLIIGGIASGKSRFAEALTTHMETNGAFNAVLYIATADNTLHDPDMQRKIDAHRARRPRHWRTLEQPYDLPDAISALQAGSLALIDCVTLWLNNMIMQGVDTTDACRDLCRAVRSADAPLILVSQEAGNSVIAPTALGRQFQNLQGQLNQDLAATTDCLVYILAGHPVTVKGRLPQV